MEYFDPNVLSRFVRIYQESPELDSYQDYICSCEVKTHPHLKQNIKTSIYGEDDLHFIGFWALLPSLQRLWTTGSFYYHSDTKTYESVCKPCYIPHYKPYKMKKLMTSTVEEYI